MIQTYKDTELHFDKTNPTQTTKHANIHQMPCKIKKLMCMTLKKGDQVIFLNLRITR